MPCPTRPLPTETTRGWGGMGGQAGGPLGPGRPHPAPTPGSFSSGKKMKFIKDTHTLCYDENRSVKEKNLLLQRCPRAQGTHTRAHTHTHTTLKGGQCSHDDIHQTSFWHRPPSVRRPPLDPCRPSSIIWHPPPPPPTRPIRKLPYGTKINSCDPTHSDLRKS